MSDCFARPQAPWALRVLPPFPTIAQRILALAGCEDINLRELEALVKLDPSFSAELLRFANSALFSLRGEVTSLAHAILLVGTDRIKTMATLVAVNRMVRNSVKVEALRKVWIHSLVTAVIVEEAAHLAGMHGDSGYTAGLLHNLGSLGLMSAYPDEYSRMLEVSDDFGFDLLATERDLFEIDHCAAGTYIANDWGFPAELAAVIATHHEDPAWGDRSLANLVRTGWRLADALGYAAFSPARDWPWQELMACLPPGKGSWLTESAETAQAVLVDRVAAAPL